MHYVKPVSSNILYSQNLHFTKLVNYLQMVVHQFSKVKILRVEDVRRNRFDVMHNSMNLLSKSLEFWNFSERQTLESRVDERSNLLRWFQPSPDSNHFQFC